MVVETPVQGEGALVEAGGHYRQIFGGQTADGGLPLLIGVLDPHLEGLPAGPGAQAVEVPPQVDDGGGDPLPPEEVRQPVGDIALGDASQVDDCLRVRKGDGVPLHRYRLPAGVGQAAGYFLPVGQRRVLRGKVPQLADSPHGDVESAAGAPAVVQPQGDDLGQLVGHLGDLPVIQAVELAVRVRPGKNLLIAGAQVQGGLGSVPPSPLVNPHGHSGVQKEGAGLRGLSRLSTAGQQQAQGQQPQKQLSHRFSLRRYGAAGIMAEMGPPWRPS